MTNLNPFFFFFRWSCMAKLMKNRTDNDIKNKWNSMVRTQKAHVERYGYSQQLQEAATAPNKRKGLLSWEELTDEQEQLADPSSYYPYSTFAGMPQTPVVSYGRATRTTIEHAGGKLDWQKYNFKTA
jgi:hypothetical protein